MTHRFSVEALDINIHGIIREKRLFRGKSIVFSDDWRQIGPVVRFGDEGDIVEAAVIPSPLFSHFDRIRLTISQRDREDAQYASFVHKVSEGRIKSFTLNSSDLLIPLDTDIDAPVTDTQAFAIAPTNWFEDLVKYFLSRFRIRKYSSPRTPCDSRT